MFEKDLNLAILDEDENLLGFLHPRYVDVTEFNELGGLRNIKITHPLSTTTGEDLSRYSNLLQMGNKVWREVTSDGDSCLYVILEDKLVDSTKNLISVRAEEVAGELSMLPPFLLNTFNAYYDDFEDGKLTSRSLPYQNWTVEGGTGVIESVNPISGKYSIKHTGNGSITASNIVRKANTGRNSVINFKLRLNSSGSGTYDPYLCLWKLKRINSSNDLSVWTWYDNSTDKQIIELYRMNAGSGTIIKDAELMNGKLPADITYNFTILDNGNNVKVLLNGSQKLDANYSCGFSYDSYVGFGCNGASSAWWDEIYVQPANPKNPTVIDASLLESFYGNYFNIGTVKEGYSFEYNGCLTPMALIREIEAQTGCEFQFRYEYDTNTDKIIRYLDFIEKKGKDHSEGIDIGYNTDNIILEESEDDVAIAAAPTGTPKDDTSEAMANFQKTFLSWLGLEVNPAVQIPLWVTKDEQGNEVYGPMVYPPYPKISGSPYVYSIAESSASYQKVKAKKGLDAEEPRIVHFESSEENIYNIYWLCVGKIRERLHPKVRLSTDIINIRKLKDYEPSYFNVGDRVSLIMPGRQERVEARIISTEKNPRNFEADSIELGNYQIDFFADYLKTFYPRLNPYE